MKKTLVRGTTPSIQFHFKTVDTSAISIAYLVIRCCGRVVVEKDLSEATVSEQTITWKLTQDETLKLRVGDVAVVCCDWKLTDGTRGRSKVAEYMVEPAGKSKVI
jgi:hypothetical protein